MPFLNPVFYFPTELEEWAIDEGPREPQGFNPWDSGNANPWKMRANYDATEDGSFEIDSGSIIWAVSLDETWWRSVWTDLDPEQALNFWRYFATTEARQARRLALRGTARDSWADVETAFNAGRMFAREGEGLYKFLSKEQMAESVETIKRNLGEWLYNAIKSGDSGAIRKLSALVAGKGPPEPSSMASTEKFRILTGFATHLTEHFRLPTNVELSAKVAADTIGKGNFQKHARELGLNGLP
jgi:hypothetical protein